MTDYHELFHHFFQVNRQLLKSINETLSTEGLYSAQWTIIYYLKQHGASTQKNICQYLNVEAPTMTRTVARLEKSGWIERLPGKDKREKYIQLTSRALNQFKVWKDKITMLEADVLNGISVQEQEMLKEILIKMKKNIDERG